MKNTTTGRKRVIFTLDSEPGKKVFVAGTFNNWQPRKKPLKDKQGNGHYETTLLLEPGSYEYKLLVDEAWCADPTCPDWILNEFGSLNSIVQVA